MSGLKQQIEEIFSATFKDFYGEKWKIYDDDLKKRILGLLAEYVVVPRKQLEDMLPCNKSRAKAELIIKLLGDKKPK